MGVSGTFARLKPSRDCPQLTRSTVSAVVAILWLVGSPAFATDYPVTKISDTNDGVCDADCSLREAILAANGNVGADRVVLGTGLLYTLTRGPADAPGALTATTGDLDITDALTIDGNGSIVDAAGIDRVFDIQGTFTVTINALTVKGGIATGFLSVGGGIYIRAATVVLNNCTVTSNSTAAESTVRDNGGGIAAIGSYDPATAMATLATLTLNGGSVTANTGLNGGGMVCVLCSVTLAQANVSGNTATADGGAADVVGHSSTLTMTGGSAATNTAAARGGALAIPFGTSTSTLTRNQIAANTAGTGSAIFNAFATVSAVNNWWGCNYGPGSGGAGCGTVPNGINGAAASVPYLVLRIAAAAASVNPNTSTNVTADLTYNSAASDTSAGGYVLNGVTASFAGTLGAFATPTSPTVAGTATDLYTAGGSLGTASITTAVDGQSLSTSINIAWGSFTDDTLTVGVTTIRVVHITELRTRVNAARAKFGLAAFAFTDPTLIATTTLVKAQHVIDLRTALAEAYAAASLAAPTYTDPALAPGMSIKAVHITQLRSAVQALE